MAEGIGTLDELRSLCLYSQLNLAKNKIVETNVEQDVIGAKIQPVFDSNYLYLFRESDAQLSDVLVYSEYFPLF